MEQYIPKSALAAKIEKRGNICKKVVLDLRTKENKDYYQGKAEAYKETLDFLDTLEVKEVSISKDLEEAAEDYCKSALVGSPYIKKNAFKAGAKWKVHHLWKPADGDELPEIDREVVAFQETFPTDVDVPSLLKIVIAHRPNPNGWYGKSVTTGKIEHYTPKTYDKGGWNIPNVKWWLDCDLPNEIKKVF